jgi:hypothetical protein
MFCRWGWGPKTKGYCGETSMQAAGLFFGNWFSQQKVRAVARNQEVLIDANAEFAARALWLTHERWDINKVKQPQATKFLKWAHAHISASAPVLFGVYHRMPGGDPDYDHIVLAHGVSKSAGVVSALHYFDWYLNSSRTFATASPGEPTSDIRSRAQCRQTETPVQPYGYCVPLEYVSALAITGNRDPHSETFRVVLSVGSWSEPDWGAEDKVRCTLRHIVPGEILLLLTFWRHVSVTFFNRHRTD